MKNILAIETSTPVCSVALQTGDGRIKEKRIEGRGVHSEYTVQFVNELLERAGLRVDDLDAVYFSNGPGSYTGLRIGAALIKGLLFQKDVPLFLFPTLLSFMAGQSDKISNSQNLHAVIDARRNHLYYQQAKSDFSEISEPEVLELGKVTDKIENGDLVIGSGWDRLNRKDFASVRWLGLEGVTGSSLIWAAKNPELKKYFVKGDVELFEPNYLTMSQINNTTIGG
ncbi:tRNA (adenosine(37)-N6)-threonylcarbamoyltransferase complex dimerization subunit type 1 TsaB [Rhodohalobacter halophilus]|uniref:tRNA (adenosine(37)-N6)-threonylcarbamoyltransferase complex dimerization subunit type 1 TsaB n=1 Tax=Rhodohalobacter halophilus TaxID=1812810 RepID=UPI00083FA1CD|nr:tRNA (adenosine(37)-N6)-threonylcarbamoyltransferase complex dimerization subunit type 1 TsaB [Rhodohalobacter halophilus]